MFGEHCTETETSVFSFLTANFTDIIYIYGLLVSLRPVRWLTGEDKIGRGDIPLTFVGS